MPTRRQARINALLYEELSLIVPAEASEDPRMADVNITVTRVEATQDMSTAKVYFTTDGEEAEVASVLATLKAHEGELRSDLADLGLRRLPHLVFARDRDYESGERVLEILERLRAEREAGGDVDVP